MRKSFLLFFMAVIIITGCSKNELDKDYHEYEGIVANKDPDAKNNKFKILVIPGIESSDVMNKSDQKIMNLINEDTSYYYVDEKTYDSLQAGQKVHIKAGLEQLDSFPPIRFVQELDIIEEP